MKGDKIKKAVKHHYSRIAEQSGRTSCCATGCCGEVSPLAEAVAAGYSKEDLEHIPQEAIMGLGCGNPAACAELKPGETVLDLGSGGGIDVFLAAIKVGPQGKAIGIDMTEQMVDKANRLAREKGYQNVEFRLGEIEKLPISDSSVDTIISNCVINLSADKSKVFREAYRVLKPGGKLVVSDIVSERPLPRKMQDDLVSWSQCVSGALERNEYLSTIVKAGFSEPTIISQREFYVETGMKKLGRLFSIIVRANKKSNE
ncbi:MAG: arsenite methyltransferase [Chloroflexi bacterium]|nr:arsenite methyltransferase [Chloroflexota bacterium]